MPRGRPANSGRARMRVDRAMSTADSGNAEDIIDELRKAQLEIVKLDIEAAKEGNNESRKRILDLAEDDIYRARSGQASDILNSLAAVREKGSKINERNWARIMKKYLEAVAE